MKFRTPSTLRETFAQINRIGQDSRLVLWSLSILLLPFYFFDSGLPQPADCLSLTLLIVLMRSWNGRLPHPFVRPLKFLIVFVAYIVLVNFVWSLLTLSFSVNAKVGFLIAPTFYIFNSLMFFTFMLMFQRYGEFLLWLTARLVLSSVFLQVLMAFVMRRALGRSTVMFNNPNQLGYYALLSACIVLLGQKRLRLSTLQVTAGLAACSYLALLSASKAVLSSIAGLGLVLLISKIRTVVLVAIVFAALIFTDNPFSSAIEHAQQRIENDQSLGFFEERGYDRIVAYPQYWVLGAGEGGYNRFKEVSAIGSHELHSSMATLFFCYGAVGILIFGLFLFGTMWGAGIRAWFVVGSAVAYGMTHQGLRFRLLWVLLGMIIALRELAARDRAARSGKAAT